MARQEGTLKLTSNIEPRMNAPLDARSTVPTKADLYTLEYAYEGMIVSLKTGGAFQLVGSDPALEANWVAVGGDAEGTLEPRVAAIENGTANIKHTITAAEVATIFNNEFENPSASLGEGHAVGVYIRSEGTPTESDWFSKTDGGAAITPEENVVYLVLSEGDYHWFLYVYSNNYYRHVGEAESAVSEWFHTPDPVTTITIPELSMSNIKGGAQDRIDFNNGITLDRVDGYTGVKDNVNFTKALGVIRCNEPGERIDISFEYSHNGQPVLANRRGLFIRANGTVLESFPHTNGAKVNIERSIITTNDMVGKDIHIFYGKATANTGVYSHQWIYGGTSKKYAPVEYYRYISSSKLNSNALVREMAKAVRENTKSDDTKNVQSVNTKTDLYTLKDTYRGMIVYVTDENQHYKLVNDLPAYEASWEKFNDVDYKLIEVTTAEIDAMFA